MMENLNTEESVLKINVMNLSVQNQIIAIDVLQNIIENTKNIYTMTCNFDEMWNGFVKTVVMYNGNNFQIYILDETEVVEIPSEVILAGRFYVSIFGVNQFGQILTTKKGMGIRFQKDGDDLNIIPDIFTPTEFERLMTELASVRIEISENREQMEESLNEMISTLETVTQLHDEVVDNAEQVSSDKTAIETLKNQIDDTAVIINQQATRIEQQAEQVNNDKIAVTTLRNETKTFHDNSKTYRDEALVSRNDAESFSQSAQTSETNAKNYMEQSEALLGDVQTEHTQALEDIGNTLDSAIESIEQTVDDSIGAIEQQTENAVGQITQKTQEQLALIPEVVQIKEDLSALTGRVTTVESTIPPLQKQMADHERELEALWLLNEGQTYREETVSATAMENTVPTGARFGEVLEYGGKSVVWNQLNDNNYTAYRPGSVKISRNQSDSITITVLDNTSTVKSAMVFYNKIIMNHVYYMRGYITGDGQSYAKLMLSRTNGEGISDSIVGWVELNANRTFHSFIGTPSVSSSGIEVAGIGVRFKNDTPINSFCIVDKLKLFDLTKLFGAGNEPTTTDDPRIQWIEQYVAEHPEYNEGEIIHAMVDDVEVKGRNLFDWDTLLDYWHITPSYVSGDKYTVEFSGLGVSDGGAYINAYANPYRLTDDVAQFSISADSIENISGLNFRIGICTINADGSITNRRMINNEVLSAVFTGNAVYLDHSQGGIRRVSGIMVALSNTIVPYSPYTEQHQPIPTAIQQLDGYGWGISDTVRNYVDFEKKQYVQMVEKYVFTGNEQYESTTKYASFTGLVTQLRAKALTLNAITTNGLKPITTGIGDNSGTVLFGSSGNLSVNTRSVTGTETISDMIGVELFYELAEPIITPLTDNMLLDAFITETGGTVTFHNSNLLDVPNKVKYAVKLSEVVSV